MSETFSKELLDLVKNSVSERGLEKSLYDTIANQYVLEQIQTEFHCVLNALAQTLISQGVVDPDKLLETTNKLIKTQEEELKKVLEKDRQEKLEDSINDEEKSDSNS